jgi:hypothetical protein
MFRAAKVLRYDSAILNIQFAVVILDPRPKPSGISEIGVPRRTQGAKRRHRRRTRIAPGGQHVLWHVGHRIALRRHRSGVRIAEGRLFPTVRLLAITSSPIDPMSSQSSTSTRRFVRLRQGS